MTDAAPGRGEMTRDPAAPASGGDALPWEGLNKLAMDTLFDERDKLRAALEEGLRLVRDAMQDGDLLKELGDLHTPDEAATRCVDCRTYHRLQAIEKALAPGPGGAA